MYTIKYLNFVVVVQFDLSVVLDRNELYFSVLMLLFPFFFLKIQIVYRNLVYRIWEAKVIKYFKIGLSLMYNKPFLLNFG